MHDHSGITDQIIDQRFRVIETSGYSEYFEAMLPGDKQQMLDEARIPPEELTEIEAEVLIMHGRNDLPIPAAETPLAVPARSRAIFTCSRTAGMLFPGNILGRL